MEIKSQINKNNFAQIDSAAGSLVNETKTRARLNLFMLNELLGLLSCIGLMIGLGWICRDRMNPDAVHYLRLASYYVDGRPDLAVSGHWSPLISLLMAPMLGLGVDPLVTARIITGFSGLIFWLGGLFLLKRLGLSSLAVALAVWVMCVSCACWSVATISPDLLGAGLICFATGAAFSNDWITNWKRQCCVGCLWALAYYGKAVAFPLAILFLFSLVVWRVVWNSDTRASGARALALTFVAFMVLAGPWVALLSIKYQRFNISTASRAASVLVGPQSEPRTGPFDVPSVPEPGRISVIESFDCSSVWSPFENIENAQHQFRLLLQNGIVIKNLLQGFDFFSIGFLSLFIVLILVLFERVQFRENMWTWSFVPVLSLAAIYSTKYCYDQRYYWVLLPFFLALAFGLAELVIKKTGVSKISKYAIYSLIALSFTLNPLRNTVAILRHHTEEKGVSSHREIARKLREKQLAGPVAGSSVKSPSCDLYVAYFLSQPKLNLNRYYGDTTPITVTQLLNSTARIIILGRHDPLAKELSGNRFRDLDQELFDDAQIAARSDLKVFELMR